MTERDVPLERGFAVYMALHAVAALVVPFLAWETVVTWEYAVAVAAAGVLGYVAVLIWRMRA